MQQPYWNTVYLDDFPDDELLNMIDHAYDTMLTVLLWIMAAVFFINAAICMNKGIGYVIANIIIGVCLLLVSGPINSKDKHSDNDSKNDSKSES